MPGSPYARITPEGHAALDRLSLRTGVTKTEIVSRLALWGESIDPLHLAMILQQFPPSPDVVRLLLERLEDESGE